MRAAIAAMGLGLVLAVTGLPGQSNQAQAQFGVDVYGGGYYGPSVGFHIGTGGWHRPYRYHRHYRYHRPYYYGGYYRPYRWHRPYYSRRHYVPRAPRAAGSCAYWAQRCAASWGGGGANFRGCLRYHRC